MSIVKSFSVGDGDMFYIEHNSDSFTIIDCCSGGPRELDRKPGTLSGTLLGACYAALC